MQGMLNQILEFGGGTGRTIFSILADTALKGAVLIAAAAIAAYFLRKKSAAARHAVWTAAVLGHLALPVLSVLVPEWRIPLLPAPGWLAEPTASSSIELPADVDLKESTPSPVTDARELTEPAAVDARPAPCRTRCSRCSRCAGATVRRVTPVMLSHPPPALRGA